MRSVKFIETRQVARSWSFELCECCYSTVKYCRELVHCLRETLEDAMSTTQAPSVQENFRNTFGVIFFPALVNLS